MTEQLTTLLKKLVPDFNPNTPLDQQINSLDFFKVILEIERHFNIQFAALELIPDNFKDLKTLTNIIAQKSLKT